MSLLIGITVQSGYDIQKVHIQSLNDIESPDTKDVKSILDFLVDFLCVESAHHFSVEEFSPFGNWIRFNYTMNPSDQTITMIWEHIQD